MTTLAVYEGWLISDGRFTDEGELLDDSCAKVYKRSDGYIVTGAGDGAPIEVFMRGDFWKDITWLEKGGPDFDLDFLKQFKDCTCWVYRPGDKFIYQSTKKGFDPLPIRGGLVQAIGSGAAYFKGAMTALIENKKYLGLSNKQMMQAAMNAAIANDLYTGGKVTITRLK